MKKHLFVESISILDFDNPMVEIGHKEYLIKRLQFTKYRKHRTMGRPVLLLRKSAKPTNS